MQIINNIKQIILSPLDIFSKNIYRKMWPNLYRSFKRGSQYPIIILETRDNKIYPFQMLQSFVWGDEDIIHQDLSSTPYIPNITPKKFLYQGYIEESDKGYKRHDAYTSAGVEIHYHDDLIPLIIKLSKKILLTKNNIIINNCYKLPITDQGIKAILKPPKKIAVKDYHNIQLEIGELFR
jgi:hypothetical protein